MVNGVRKRARCFIIQPFGVKETPCGKKVNNNLIYKELKKLETIDPDFPIEVYRADTQKYKRENLHSHVADCIEESHFCIVDLNGGNHNVLYELGYARGLGKKTIILCRSKKEIPGDMNGVMYIEYRDDNLNDLSNKIYGHLEKIDNGVDAIIENDLDRVLYLPKRNDDLIRSKLCNASTKIDILQTNLSVLSYEFVDDIVKAMEKNDDVGLRILTLDPQSIFVNYRAHQLGYTKVGIFRDELSNALDNIAFKMESFKSRVRIKTYDDFPTQIAFHIDSEILACVVSATGRSRDNCAFLLPDSMLGAHKSFVEHFENLWHGKTSRDHDDASDGTSSV